jgi:hypothetical protein
MVSGFRPARLAASGTVIIARYYNIPAGLPGESQRLDRLEGRQDVQRVVDRGVRVFGRGLDVDHGVALVPNIVTSRCHKPVTPGHHEYLRSVTYDELLELALRFRGQPLETVSGKRFTVDVYRDCPFFTPESTGRGQSDGRKAAERFVERYRETKSHRPGDYADVTRNASYYIGLLIAGAGQATD